MKYVVELRDKDRTYGYVLKNEDKEGLKEALIEKLNEGLIIISSYIERDDSTSIMPLMILFNKDNEPLICEDYLLYGKKSYENKLTIRELKQIVNDIDEEYLDLPVFSFPDSHVYYVGLCSVYNDNPQEYGLIIR